MNKRVLALLVLASFLTIIVSNFSSAQSATCDTNQTMLYLTGVTNAHGSTLSSSGYPIKICYDKIFGTKYLGSNPNTCSPTNKIVRLSGTNNAHAEVTSQSTPGYSNVCYGNVACTTKTLQNCASDEKEVLRLNQNTNSHLSLNGTGIGPIAICCKLTGNVTGAHWENMINQEITQTNKGSTVQMVVPGSDLSSVLIDYTIEKKGTTWVFFTSWSSVNSISTRGVAQWTVNELGTYRFTATIVSTGSTQTSPELSVVEGTNSLPVVSIISPRDTGLYFLSTTLNFSQETYDVDDASLSYLWNFGDGSTSNLHNVTHSYNNPGQKRITLKVTDSRGGSSEAEIDVLMVNSTYMLAKITSPYYGQSVNGLLVTFNGSSSYAATGNHNPKNADCVVGRCGIAGLTDDGYPLSNNPASINPLNFSWILNDNYYKSAMGISGVRWDYQFNSPGNKWAQLTARYNNSLWSSTWINFTVSSSDGAPYCSLVGGKSYWVTSSGSVDSAATSTCYKSNGEPTTTCCPSGYSCDQGSGACIAKNSSDPQFCGDYTTQNSCTNYELSVAEDSVEALGVTCGEVIDQYEQGGRSYREVVDNCRCEWASTNVCNAAYNITKECVAGDCLPQSVGICETSIIEESNSCSAANKFRTYNIISTWSGSSQAPESCQNGTLERSCIDFSQVKLPFFGLNQALITIALIIILYLYLSSKKKNKRKDGDA